MRTSYTFTTQNGGKGDTGDSAVYDPSSPDTPDFVMANTTGQSTTKAMTQKAVTEYSSYYSDLDLSNAEYVKNIVNGQNKWANVTGAASVLIPVKAGDEIHCVGNGVSSNFIYAFLTNNVTTAGTTPSFATGYNARVVADGDAVIDLIAPSDATYLWLMQKNSEGFMMPYMSVPNNIASMARAQFDEKLLPSEKWHFSAGDMTSLDKRCSDPTLYYIKAGMALNIPTGMQLGLQQFNEDGQIGSEIAVNAWLDGIYTFSNDGWYRFLARNTSNTTVTEEQVALMNAMPCVGFFKHYPTTSFRGPILFERTTGKMTFYEYSENIPATWQTVNDRFFELNGEGLTVNCNQEFFVVFFNSHYEVVSDTITLLGDWTKYINLFDYSSLGAKYIRIVAQGANMCEDVKADIMSGVYDNIRDSADVTVSVNSDTEIIAPNDDATGAIQQALFLAYIRGGKAILYEDDYILNSTTPWTDSNNAPKCCIWAPHYIDELSQYSNPMQFFTLEGTKQPLSYGGGVRLILGTDVYNEVADDSPLSVIRTQYQSTYSVISTSGGVCGLCLRNMNILLPNNDKAITAIDLRYAHGCNIENVHTMAGYSTLNWGAETPPPIANPNCVGIRGLLGSNWSVLNTFTNVEAFGYYIGIDFSGEHVSGRNISVKYNYYGLTFGYLQQVGAHHHPITLINILDEHSVCMPIFGTGGKTARQEINMLGYNLMWPSWVTQGNIGANDARHRRAVEQGGNGWGGVIHYTNNTAQDTGNITNNVLDSPFFETGGKNIKCVNTANSRSGNDSNLAAIEPNFLQRFWHTTRNQECIFDGVNWKNVAGEVVYEYPTYTLSGTVTSESSPVVGATVKYTYRGVDYTTTTDGNGAYSLSVPKWTGTIEISKNDYDTFSRRVKMTANMTLNAELTT